MKGIFSMGYNKEDYTRIKEEFSNKYIRAREVAEARRRDIHTKIPEIFEIDMVLSRTGMDVMSVISAGGKDATEKIAELEKRNNALIAKRGALLEAQGYPTDYTDVHYECEKCGDTGYIETTMCDCMKRALAQAGYESSGLGALIGKQTFENFKLEYYSEKDGIRQKMNVAYNIIKGFADSFDKNTSINILLTGGTGLGKTHLSTALAQAVIDKGFDVLYVSAVGMLGDFEERRFGNSSSLSRVNDISRYYDADLLIIDDLGTEVVNKFTQSYLYEVINTRINTRKSTVVSTNLTPAEINATYSERISSRILGEYQPILFRGVDIRKQRSWSK